MVWIDGQAKVDPASAVDAMMALARLGIVAPRSLLEERAALGLGCQHDDHTWLQYDGEQWRIVGIEDGMLCLKKMFTNQEKQIDLTKAKWTNYTAAAVKVLEAMGRA